MLEMLKRKRIIFSLTLTVILLMSFSGTAFADMPTDTYSNWEWYTQYDLNTTNSYIPRQTRLIQRACNALGGFGLEADGIYGDLTEDAVEMVQSTVGLTADGDCGSDTWEAFQYEYNWTKSSRQYWSKYNRYYYYYYSVGDSSDCIRHCNNGYWYALDDDGSNWYAVY